MRMREVDLACHFANAARVAMQVAHGFLAYAFPSRCRATKKLLLIAAACADEPESQAHHRIGKLEEEISFHAHSYRKARTNDFARNINHRNPTEWLGCFPPPGALHSTSAAVATGLGPYESS